MLIDLHVSGFFGQIFGNIQISNFMKICWVGAELFHADGQTARQTDRQTWQS